MAGGSRDHNSNCRVSNEVYEILRGSLRLLMCLPGSAAKITNMTYPPLCSSFYCISIRHLCHTNIRFHAFLIKRKERVQPQISPGLEWAGNDPIAETPTLPVVRLQPLPSHAAEP
jgi:hypothetical protein